MELPVNAKMLNASLIGPSMLMFVISGNAKSTVKVTKKKHDRKHYSHNLYIYGVEVVWNPQLSVRNEQFSAAN